VDWRRGAYMFSAIAASGLILELGWWLIDPKGDARHMIDRMIRTLTH